MGGRRIKDASRDLAEARGPRQEAVEAERLCGPVKGGGMRPCGPAFASPPSHQGEGRMPSKPSFYKEEGSKDRMRCRQTGTFPEEPARRTAAPVSAGQWAALVGGGVLAALLLMEPEAAALGALNAMLCWAQTVAPAMFPFMALLPLLTGPAATRACEKLLGRPMRALFRLPGSAAGALVAGMLGGSPAGALAVRRMHGIRQGQMRRLGTAAAGLSPVFLVGGVGAGMLGSVEMGRVLLRAQIGSQLTLLLLTRGAWRNAEDILPDSETEAAPPLRGAVLSILTVGGWMTLFGALGQAARRILGSDLAGILCLVDVVTGVEHISHLPLNGHTRMLLLAAVCGFGGACIGLQNLAILREAGLRPGMYFATRMLAAALYVLLTEAQLGFWLAVPGWFSVSDAVLILILSSISIGIYIINFMKKSDNASR